MGSSYRLNSWSVNEGDKTYHWTGGVVLIGAA